MNTATRELYVRIRAFSIDEGQPVLSFETRLARENDWSIAFARRVEAEYKRFVFLAMTSGHAVTPSTVVDEAWHLHLMYTRSYWQRFCGDVLGRPLHHEPTRGGPDEDAKFRRQYQQTLTAYRETFDEDPPADIWPRPSARPGPGCPIVSKSVARRAGLATAALACVVTVTGCGAAMNPFDLPGVTFLKFLIPLLAVALIIGYMWREWLRGPGPQPDDKAPQIDWDEAAYLAAIGRGRGAERLSSAAIARLAAAGAVRV
ncbi:MAG TPA: hypothetical protein VKE40_04305, partial [Gemmataceae bacterium]|nr:hypothetical protein [Gemmataceae bacterium]